MPKAAKLSTSEKYRSAPYSASTSTTIAPAPALAPSTMPSQAAMSFSHPKTDRHGAHTWSTEDDTLLMRARQQGLNWQPIAAQHFPDKTANACRKRHERLMDKRKSADSWDENKITEMARHYLDVRQQMWGILADKIHESWQDVEAKCMERGLKTLHASGKSAARRVRQQSSFSTMHQTNGDDPFNDSGLPPDPESQYSLSNHNEYQRQSNVGSFHQEPLSYSAGTGTITPPYTTRSYSHSSASTIPTTSPYATIQNSSPYQRAQTLPSFSAAFGQPNIPVLQPPISRPSPN